MDKTTLFLRSEATKHLCSIGIRSLDGTHVQLHTSGAGSLWSNSDVWGDKSQERPALARLKSELDFVLITQRGSC